MIIQPDNIRLGSGLFGAYVSTTCPMVGIPAARTGPPKLELAGLEGKHIGVSTREGLYSAFSIQF
jgi:hypothetical protein